LALSKIDLHRGNGILRPRDKPPKMAFRPETVSRTLPMGGAKRVSHVN
jgi:hypothetical protein